MRPQRGRSQRVIRPGCFASCLMLGAVLIGGCSGGPSVPASSNADASPPSASPPSAGAALPSDGVSASGSPPASPAAGTGGQPGQALSPTQTALRLEAVIGQHSVLATDMMRSRIRGDSGLAQAADAALRQNTQDLGGLLEPTVGAAGREQFEDAWAEHIEGLFNYARGLSTGDQAVRKDAHEELVEYEDDLARLFAAASAGRLGRDAALDAVRMHVDHLLAAADAYAAKDFGTAARLYRVSFDHTFDLGEQLARALLPASVGVALDTPSLRLRSALTKLLGEHVALVVETMRSSVGDLTDFSAMGVAVNGNTTDLTAAVDSLFGPAAAREFQSRWADHVDELFAYTRAVGGRDTVRADQARGRLRAFEQALGGFLDTATGGRLGRPALADALGRHDRMLLAEIDAYAAGDFQQAYDLSYQAYDEMTALSATLSSAIGATVAARLPRGGSQTGGGGAAALVAGR